MSSQTIAHIQTQLIGYFYEKGRTAFKLAEDSYDDWALLLCEQGSFDYRIDEDSGTVKVGEFVLCPPGYTLSRKINKRLTFHFANFKLEALNKDGEKVFYPYFGKLSCRNSMRLMYTMEQMRQSKNTISIHYTEHLLNDILYQILDEHLLLRQKQNPVDQDILEAIRYLNEYAFSGISLTEAAEHVGLSPSQFTRKFQKEMSVSPSKYLTRLRLQKVCRLLIETNYTLEEIAEQSGYQNAFYLSRVFSKEYEISPSHYRRLHQV